MRAALAALFTSERAFYFYGPLFFMDRQSASLVRIFTYRNCREFHEQSSRGSVVSTGTRTHRGWSLSRSESGSGVWRRLRWAGDGAGALGGPANGRAGAHGSLAALLLLASR